MLNALFLIIRVMRILTASGSIRANPFTGGAYMYLLGRAFNVIIALHKEPHNFCLIIRVVRIHSLQRAHEVT